MDTDQFRKVYSDYRKAEAKTISAQYSEWAKHSRQLINAIDIATVKRPTWSIKTEIVPVDSLESKKLYPKSVDDLNPLDSTFTVKPNEGTTHLFLDQWRQGLGLPTRSDDVAIEQFKQARKRNWIEGFKALSTQARSSEFKLKEGNEIIGLAKNLFGAVASSKSAGPLQRIAQEIYDKLLRHGEFLQPGTYLPLKQILEAITNEKNTGRLDIRILQAFREKGQLPPPNTKETNAVEIPAAAIAAQSGIPPDPNAGPAAPLPPAPVAAVPPPVAPATPTSTKSTVTGTPNSTNVTGVSSIVGSPVGTQTSGVSVTPPSSVAAAKSTDSSINSSVGSGIGDPNVPTPPAGPPQEAAIVPLSNDDMFGLISTSTESPAGAMPITPSQLIGVRDTIKKCQDIVANGLAKAGPGGVGSISGSYPINSVWSQVAKGSPMDQTVSLQQYNALQDALATQKIKANDFKAAFQASKDVGSSALPPTSDQLLAEQIAEKKRLESLQNFEQDEINRQGQVQQTAAVQRQVNTIISPSAPIAQAIGQFDPLGQVAAAQQALQPPAPTLIAPQPAAPAAPPPPQAVPAADTAPDPNSSIAKAAAAAAAIQGQPSPVLSSLTPMPVTPGTVNNSVTSPPGQSNAAQITFFGDDVSNQNTTASSSSPTPNFSDVIAATRNITKHGLNETYIASDPLSDKNIEDMLIDASSQVGSRQWPVIQSLQAWFKEKRKNPVNVIRGVVFPPVQFGDIRLGQNPDKWAKNSIFAIPFNKVETILNTITNSLGAEKADYRSNVLQAAPVERALDFDMNQGNAGYSSDERPAKRSKTVKYAPGYKPKKQRKLERAAKKSKK